jgi:hypothetical protein
LKKGASDGRFSDPFYVNRKLSGSYQVIGVTRCAPFSKLFDQPTELLKRPPVIDFNDL